MLLQPYKFYNVSTINKGGIANFKKMHSFIEALSLSLSKMNCKENNFFGIKLKIHKRNQSTYTDWRLRCPYSGDNSDTY